MTRSPDAYSPRPEHRFSFGLWGVCHRGEDGSGGPTRPPLDPVDAVHLLADHGAWGVSAHDDDLIPHGASAGERDRLLRRFASALADSGLVLGMACPNLASHPAFKDGALTSNDRAVRRLALGKALRWLDDAAALGARNYVLWIGREGADAGAAKDPRDALERYREAVDLLVEHAVEQRYALRFALEPQPHEPRGDLWLPTTGHALHFISTLQRPDHVGVNLEVGHERMSGLSPHHAAGQALWAGKLFHVDLNGQRAGRHDQDLRFGAEDLKESFLLVRLLERSGYDGPRHFDARPLRSEDRDGVGAFVAGCMRTYLVLAERARRFDALTEVRAALAAAGADALAQPTSAGPEEIAALVAAATPAALDAHATRGYANERLDQLLVDVLTGVL